MNQNIAAVLIAMCVLACVLSGTIIILKQPGAQIPDFLKGIASVGIGALAAMVAIKGAGAPKS